MNISMVKKTSAASKRSYQYKPFSQFAQTKAIVSFSINWVPCSLALAIISFHLFRFLFDFGAYVRLTLSCFRSPSISYSLVSLAGVSLDLSGCHKLSQIISSHLIADKHCLAFTHSIYMPSRHVSLSQNVLLGFFTLRDRFGILLRNQI